MASRPSDEASVPVGSSRRMPHIGPWRLLELRSGGAYGQVYRAEPLHSPGAPPVALKLAVHPMDPRFLREAGVLRRVPHPHIPRLYELGLWDHLAGPFPYLVMEWIEGQSLYVWAHGRVLSSRQMMRMLAPMAETLQRPSRRRSGLPCVPSWPESSANCSRRSPARAGVQPGSPRR